MMLIDVANWCCKLMLQTNIANWVTNWCYKVMLLIGLQICAADNTNRRAKWDC